jgi:hypothetical protein
MIIALLSCAQGAFAPSAHAIASLGLALAGGSGVPLLVLGGVFFLGGSTVVASNGSGHGSSADLGRLLIVLGVILLDSDAGVDLNFGEVSASEAQKMNVSAEQASHYNQELYRINLIREQIQGELISVFEKGEKVDFSTAHEKWEQYKRYISPEAYSVVEKISKNFVQNLKNI